MKENPLLQDVVNALTANSLTLFTNRRKYVPSRGRNCVSTQRLTSRRPSQHGSRPEALARAHGVRMGAQSISGIEGQRLRIVDRESTHEFKGSIGLNRMQYIPAHRLGGDKVAVDWYVTERCLLFVVDSGTYSRWLHSGSVEGSRVPATWWERRAVSRDFINLKNHRSLQRSARFFECVFSLHAQFYLLCEANRERYPTEVKDLSKLLLQMLINILTEGKCESSLVNIFKDAIEVVHKDRACGGLEKMIRSWPGPLRVSVFRLRRSLYSDMYDARPIQEQALLRLKKTPLHLSPRGQEMIKLWQSNFRLWIKLNPLKVQRARLCFHKSSSSFLSTRLEGGGARELHLVIALYRLSQGKTSYLDSAFGCLPQRMTLPNLIEFYNKIDQMEIADACVWWCTLVVERDWPLGMMITIFPEREPKSRTFAIPWMAGEVLASPAVQLVKFYLADQPETARVCGGLNPENQFRTIVSEAASPDYMRMDLDSKEATDHYGSDIPAMIYEPALEVLPAYVRNGTDFCAKRGKIALCEQRLSVLDNFAELVVRSHEFCRLDPNKSVGKYPESTRMLTRYSRTATRPLRITEHQEKIISAAWNGPFILKAFPGAGKTTFLADQKNVVISLPNIAQCVMLSKSLTSAGMAPACYWSGLEMPSKEFSGPIICTPAHVHTLLKQNLERWYVCDEADTPMEGPLNAVNDCLKRGIFTIVCSATPDALKLPLNRVELFGTTDFNVVKRKIDESELLGDVIRTQTPGNQVLILVHSEPKALALEKRLRQEGKGARALISALDDLEIEEVMEAEIIIATNKARSSITLPDLFAVYDYRRRYQYVVDSSSYAITGVITEVSQADVDQGSGRVGRIKDGESIEVINTIPCSPPMVVINDVEEAGRLNKELDVGALPLPYSSGSLAKSVITTALCGAAVNKNFFTRGLPAPIRFLKRFSLMDHARARIGLMICFENFGFKQKLLELSRSTDEVLCRIEQRFHRNVMNDDFSVAYVEVFQAFINHRLYSRETSMACRWLGLEHTSAALQEKVTEIGIWSSPSSRIAICVVMWDSLVVSNGHEYEGLIAQYRCSKEKDGPDVALLLARQHSMTSGELNFQRALPLEKEEKDLLLRMFQESKAGLDVTYSKDNGRNSYISLKKHASRPFLAVSSQPPQRYLNAHPGHLTGILEAIEASMEAVTYKEDVTTSGVNMASRISPRVLYGLCFIAGLYAKQKYVPTLEFEVFGDDFAATAQVQENLLDLISDLRGEFGMITKPSASAEQRDPDSLTVVTERFFDGNGNVVEGIKPSSFVKLFLSQNREWSMLYTDLEATDYIGDYISLSNLFPEALQKLKLRDPSSVTRRRTRVTHSRALARQIVGESSNQVTNSAGPAKVKQVEGLIGKIESLILLLSPSTRGTGKVAEPSELSQTSNQCPQEAYVALSRVLEEGLGD